MASCAFGVFSVFFCVLSPMATYTRALPYTYVGKKRRQLKTSREIRPVNDRSWPDFSTP